MEGKERRKGYYLGRKGEEIGEERERKEGEKVA
jgi:hypothetical protein